MWRTLLLLCISAHPFISTTDAAFQLHYDDDRIRFKRPLFGPMYSEFGSDTLTNRVYRSRARVHPPYAYGTSPYYRAFFGTAPLFV